MSAWPQLIRPQLRDLGPYVPGPSLAELRARLGLGEVAKLNWNEGLLGPLPGVLDAVAARLDEAWAYPEQAYDELRAAIAADAGVDAAQVLPGHGIQSLILAVTAAFVADGDRVVVPRPTYGLYAQASRAAGARVEHVDLPGLRLDLERIAAAVRRTRARLAWICDPNNPTGSRLEAGEWAAFLDALPPGCVVVADEAYMDYVPPADRVRREDDIAAGRPLVVLRTFSKIYGLAGLRLGYAIVDAALTPYLHTVQEPFNVNRAALAAGMASLGRAAELAERRAATIAARERFAAALAEGGLEPLPSAANFVLVRLGADDHVVTDRLLRRGILIRPGSEMGLAGWARITIGPDELMRRVAGELLAVCAEAAAEAPDGGAPPASLRRAAG
jgi:histidinol-phosphate aminotransferase